MSALPMRLAKRTAIAKLENLNDQVEHVAGENVKPCTVAKTALGIDPSKLDLTAVTPEQ
ncbi:hypothetical protein HLB44_34760 [Aquincola sp. S2]|uniref:Uncharacterized protein n=1 Tax=Pseudaquabacterium terrae TaxID=2732868 RepID=A0ABX2EUQ9_9BURK|nr:hypothetical protein [Aquabacterium terrae]NRF72159.1 hypothetical protein [Aquabacterium terrae]